MLTSPSRKATPTCDCDVLAAALNDIAAIAAQLCNRPIALILLDGAERIWFKSTIDHDITAIANKTRHVLTSANSYSVETTLPDGYGVTAVAIADYDGTSIGWLCVVDRAVCRLEAGQLDSLRMLGRQVAIHWVNEMRKQRVEQAFQHTQQALQDAQMQLIQAEKLSSLGEMLAGVAHEINNPVSFVHGNISYVNQYIQNLLEIVELYQQAYPQPADEIQAKMAAIDFEFLVEDLPKSLISMKLGADRLRQIVLSLRSFSRRDENEKKPSNLHEGLDNTLTILQYRLKASTCRIEIVKEYGQIPLIDCYPGQLNQVFMNLISNAIDVLEHHSQSASTQRIRIMTETISHPYPAIVVRIRDNGLGMTAETRDRIFDPFFTTKPIGKGTGLGLAISRKIVVDRHGGHLKCWSELGQGTEFSIELPLPAQPLEYFTANHSTTRPAA